MESFFTKFNELHVLENVSPTEAGTLEDKRFNHQKILDVSSLKDAELDLVLQKIATGCC